MKKLLPLLLLVGLVLMGCEQPTSGSPDSSPGIVLNKTSLRIDTGVSEVLVAQTSTSESLLWSSTDPSVATVSQSGSVVGITPGIATIIVLTKDGSKDGRCTVTVYESESKEQAEDSSLELRDNTGVLLGLVITRGQTDAFSGDITNYVSFTPGEVNGVLPVFGVMKSISTDKIIYTCSVSLIASTYVYSYANSLLQIKKPDNSVILFKEDSYKPSVSSDGSRTVISISISSKNELNELREINDICSARIATMTKGNLDFNIPVEFFDALDNI